MSERDLLHRMWNTIGAALGKPFPPAGNEGPSRQELLDAASICAGAAELAGALANEVARWEENANVIPFPDKGDG